MYALYRAFPDITQITLPKPGMPPLFGTPANVYVLHGDAPALVGTGHPSTHQALDAALAEIGLRRRDIERVIALDWSPDQLGAARQFPEADVLVAAAPGESIARYGDFLRGERQAFGDAAARLTIDPRYAAIDIGALRAASDAYWSGPETLDLVAVPGGREVRLGDRAFMLATAPGPCPGHAVLWSAEDRLLFSSRAIVERSFGRPIWRDVVPYVSTLELLHDLEPSVLLPTFGRVDTDARYALTRTHRAVTGLLGHLPFALQKQATLAGSIYLDLGRVPSQHARLVETARTRLSCLEYLAATSAIDRVGDGAETLYGASGGVGRSLT